MKVLLVTDYFYPQSSGGTEKYVHELARGLKDIGTNVTILTIGESLGKYDYDGFEVHMIPANTDSRKEVIAGLIPSNNLQYFIDMLSELKADIIHFHTLTTSISTYHYEAAEKTGAKVIFTSHIPGNTCLRGDLMRYGEEICDGKMRLNTCLSCYLNARGIPKLISPVAARLMRFTKQPPLLSQASTIKKHQLEQIKAACSTVVTMSNWQRDVFLINGFNPDQLALSRHTFKQIGDYKRISNDSHIVIGYAGRVSPEKGLHILIEAAKQLDPAKFRLIIAAIKSPAHTEYLDKLLGETTKCTHITWCFDYTQDTIDSFYKEIDTLCIPSVCNETGPYVMFESIARHIPVIASNLGGMREWATLNYPVKTYKYDNAKELLALLNDFTNNTYTSNYPPEKNTKMLAEEMINIYAGGN